MKKNNTLQYIALLIAPLISGCLATSQDPVIQTMVAKDNEGSVRCVDVFLAKDSGGISSVQMFVRSQEPAVGPHVRFSRVEDGYMGGCTAFPLYLSNIEICPGIFLFPEARGTGDYWLVSNDLEKLEGIMLGEAVASPVARAVEKNKFGDSVYRTVCRIDESFRGGPSPFVCYYGSVHQSVRMTEGVVQVSSLEEMQGMGASLFGATIKDIDFELHDVYVIPLCSDSLPMDEKLVYVSHVLDLHGQRLFLSREISVNRNIVGAPNFGADQIPSVVILMKKNNKSTMVPVRINIKDIQG